MYIAKSFIILIAVLLCPIAIAYSQSTQPELISMDRIQYSHIEKFNVGMFPRVEPETRNDNKVTIIGIEFKLLHKADNFLKRFKIKCI